MWSLLVARNIVNATEGKTLLEVAAYVILIKYFVFYRPSGKLLWKKVEDFLLSNPLKKIVHSVKKNVVYFELFLNENRCYFQL